MNNEPTTTGISSWGIMFSRLSGARDIITQLVRRDLSVHYRQSFLGYIWAIFLPVAIVLIFTYLANKRVLPIGEVSFAYPAYAIWSLVVWHLFSNILVASCQSLIIAGPLTTKVNFAKEALVLSAVGQPVFDFLIKLPLVICVFIYFDVEFSVNMLYCMAVLLLTVLMATGIGFILSILNLIYRDTEHAVNLLTTFGMFAAPILYPPPVSLPFSLVNYLNPFSPLLIATQDLISQGTINSGFVFFIYSALSILCFFCGWRIFYLVLPHVIERA